jgi:hypothetical protein
MTHSPRWKALVGLKTWTSNGCRRASRQRLSDGARSLAPASRIDLRKPDCLNSRPAHRGAVGDLKSRKAGPCGFRGVAGNSGPTCETYPPFSRLLDDGNSDLALNDCEVPQTMPSAARVHNLSNLMAEPILSKGYGPPLGCVPRMDGEMTKARLSITISRPLGVPAASSIHRATRRRNGVSTVIDRPTFSGAPSLRAREDSIRKRGSRSKPCSA